jgi:hypothetical protein
VRDSLLRVSLIERVRTLCLALPGAFEVEAWEHPTFRVGSGRGKMFCIAAEDGSSIRLKADPVEREALLAQGEPFYLPPYVGAKGWVGVRLDSQAAGRAGHRSTLARELTRGASIELVYAPP